jgi:hypothetical protein
MPRLKLNERAVAKMSTANGKDVLYWDEDLKGFGVRCSGTTKVKLYSAVGLFPWSQTTVDQVIEYLDYADAN